MSSLRPDLGFIGRGLRDRLTRARRIGARATGWPMAVRLAVFAAGLLAQGFAYPAGVFTGSPVLLALIIAALPALWPRTWMVSAAMLAIILGWLALTTLGSTPATLPRLIGLSVALYLVHTGAALAAVLPYDAVVEPLVPARWAVRAGTVAVLSGAVSSGAMLVVARLAARTYLAATLIGLAATVALVWLVATTVRRR